MDTMLASDIFQKKFESTHNSFTRETAIADGMIMYGRTEPEHDKNLITFMETIIKNRLWLNKEKLQFKWKQVYWVAFR